MLCAVAAAFPAEYSCEVVRRVSFGKTYSRTELAKWKFSFRLEDDGETAFVSRCIYSYTERKVVCDRYRADRVERDTERRVRKYYIFGAQSSFQLFHNLSGIEDDGRGDISFCRCREVPPKS